MNWSTAAVLLFAIYSLLFCDTGSCEASLLKGRDETNSYKPVVIIHGIMDKKHSLEHLQQQIQQLHNGTEVILLDKLHRWKSIAPMWYQVKVFRKVLVPIMQTHPQGIHLIGFSQGGLIARALIESLDDHNVDTFVSLSSPQGGQFGDKFLKLFYPDYMRDTAWRVFYRKTGQELSVGNYWRDPHHLQLFLSQSVFLPVLDNSVFTINSGRYKENFKRLRRLVMIGGPDDGVISPWESSQFGVYNETEEVVKMEDRNEFKADSFGLKSLWDAGNLTKITVGGIYHLNWTRNDSFISEYLVPLLT